MGQCGLGLDVVFLGIVDDRVGFVGFVVDLVVLGKEVDFVVMGEDVVFVVLGEEVDLVVLWEEAGLVVLVVPVLDGDLEVSGDAVLVPSERVVASVGMLGL